MNKIEADTARLLAEAKYLKSLPKEPRRASRYYDVSGGTRHTALRLMRHGRGTL